MEYTRALPGAVYPQKETGQRMTQYISVEGLIILE